MSRADILIRNGERMDPAAGILGTGDVALKDRRILAEGAAEEASKVIDAAGCLVVPGLIDIHGHWYYRGTWNGLENDLVNIPMGVTATVDAGSTGVSNYREMLRQAKESHVRTKILLNVSACGIVMPTQFAEPVNPEYWDTKLFDTAFQEHPEEIIGLKMRANRGVLGEMGIAPVYKALELAERYHTRLAVHVTDAPESMGKIASILRKGDVFVHVYHGTGPTILENGKVLPEILEARERGVIFDVAQGRGNFSYDVAREAIAQGFLPDTISSDTTLQNWQNGMVGALPMTMTKMLALGMELSDVIRCTTAVPAEEFGAAGDLGTLAAGTTADITILKLEETDKTYRDKFGRELKVERMFVPKVTILDGNVLYLAPDFQ